MTERNEMGTTRLTETDFLNLGVDQVGYLKPVMVKAGDTMEHAIALHAADGSFMMVAHSVDEARMAALRGDLRAVLLN